MSCMYCMFSFTHYLTLSQHLTLTWAEMFRECQQGRHLAVCSRQAGAFQYETFKSAKELKLLRSTVCQSIKSRISLIHLIAGSKGTWITWIMAVISEASWQIVFLRKWNMRTPCYTSDKILWSLFCLLPLRDRKMINGLR